MYNKIKKAIEEGRNIFITGGGGVGKSYTLNKLRNDYPSLVVTSTTGVSALNVDGQTIHSWAGVGICQDPINVTIAKVRNREDKKADIQLTEMLAIDEISMLDAEKFEYIEEVISAVRQKPRKTFGGIQVILIGDFFQLPPVGLEKGVSYCFESKLWEKLDLEVFNLEKVYRQTDKKLIKSLNDIRKGISSIKIFETREGVTPPKDVIRLYSLNNEANKYNLLQFNKINKDRKEYWSKDRIHVYKKGKEDLLKPNDPRLSKTDSKIFETFNNQCKLDHLLVLKEGARVMLLSNLDLALGLVNGSCGEVKGLEDRYVVVKFDNNKEEKIRRIDLDYYSGGQLKVTRTQIPLRLAYANSIHKAQGQTYNKVFIDFSNIFSAGQAYVALSRAKTLDGLYLKNLSEDKIMVDKRVVEFYEGLK